MERYGYVLINAAGAYAMLSERQTFKGVEYGLKWGYELSCATVFVRPCQAMKKVVDIAREQGALKVPATSKTVVTLGKKGKEDE